MLHRATLADVDRITALAAAEHSRSQFQHQPFDAAHTGVMLRGAIAGLSSVAFVSDAGRGFIVGMVQPNLFNRYQTAYELAWYAEDGSGMALLRALTAWARKMRATQLIVHSYAGIVPDARFLRPMARAGFQPLGSTFTHNLEA